jgi:tRNA modification GTPase
MYAPRTFTGQHTVEITCHNNPFIIDAIITQAIKAGARLAEHGEFTRRAVCAGKMDLLQAEALNELIGANTQQALKASLAQIHGSLSHTIVSLEKRLLQALALSEASFEFIDEEMQFGDQIRAIIDTTCTTIGTLQRSCSIQRHLKEGMRVALVGLVNAGKSSLFNAILGRSRSIVSTVPGTTRDTIEASIHRDGMHYTLIDTAGLRITDDCIEREGIERTHIEAQQADVILLIVDSSQAMNTEEQAIYTTLHTMYTSKVCYVHTKADLATHMAFPLSKAPPHINVSAATGHHIPELEETISQMLAALLNQLDTPFVLTQRQQKLIEGLRVSLQEIQALLAATTIHYEILSCHLTHALALITELTGKSISEAAMDAIFREFCIGK